MNLGVESIADGSRRPGEVNHTIRAVNHVHVKAMGFKPTGDQLDVFLRRTKPFRDLVSSEPVVILRRTAVMQTVHPPLHRLLLFG